jgi:hypothetical protein
MHMLLKITNYSRSAVVSLRWTPGACILRLLDSKHAYRTLHYEAQLVLACIPPSQWITSKSNPPVNDTLWAAER